MMAAWKCQVDSPPQMATATPTTSRVPVVVAVVVALEEHWTPATRRTPSLKRLYPRKIQTVSRAIASFQLFPISPILQEYPNFLESYYTDSFKIEQSFLNSSANQIFIFNARKVLRAEIEFYLFSRFFLFGQSYSRLDLLFLVYLLLLLLLYIIHYYYIAILVAMVFHGIFWSSRYNVNRFHAYSNKFISDFISADSMYMDCFFRNDDFNIF